MKRIALILFSGIFFACSSKGKTLDNVGGSKDSTKKDEVITPAVPARYNLVWSDEFDVNGIPDSSKWVFAGRSTPFWQQYCTDRDAVRYVQGGYLYLKGIKNTDTPADTATYHTGCICTLDKYDFLYGKVEVKVKFEKTGKGAWPAIWMMPKNKEYGPWPKSGEIDIMERINTQRFVHQTVHTYYTKNGGANDPLNTQKTIFSQPDFNIFRLEWTPDSLIFSMNDSITLVYLKKPNADYEKWPFDKSFYLILNQAAGGQWPGPVTDTELPFIMAVDWVRIYQKQ